MKIRRLYIKILISFLGVLAVTIALILVLFIFTAGRSYKAPLDQKTLSKLQIFQTLVQENIDLHPDQPIDANPDLLKQLNTFAALFDVRIWISDPADTILLKTFDGPADVPQTGVHRQVHHDNGITLYHFVLRWIKYYATIPIDYRNRDLRLHLYYDTRDPDHPEGLFFMGILGIGGLVALMVIPMAGFITRRVNRLNRTAIEFASGNLSCRTDIQGHDEIAKLGDSFNLMADKLEALIHNAKELTANVSHELRSPLARIRVSKELILDKLEQGGGREAIQRYTHSMEADIQHLDTLVAHMLTLSKMDYQESAVSREKFSFSAFLEKELVPYQALADQAGLRLEREIEKQPEVYQDRSVLKSILTNLMDNALKYTSPGGLIRIEAGPALARGLEFSITNTCQPLSDQDISMLFKPFFRVPGHEAVGSGLGLTIARKQAARCKGSLTAHQTVTGLCFRVVLP